MSSKNDNLLELYNFSSKKWHFLEAANVTFWDSENIIVKNYKNLKESLSNENLNVLNDILDESYKTLLNNNNKADYFRYLMMEYSLGQPNDIEQLINEYYSLIFPYYLFPLRNDSNDELFYCILDFINFFINIYDKNGIKNSIEINGISDINMNNETIVIEKVNVTQKIEIIPQIIDNLEMLYLLIIYMALVKNKRDTYQKGINKVNEINQNLPKNDIKTIEQKITGNNHFFKSIDISKFNLIPNDSLVPKGIIISLPISFEHNKQSPDRYLLLGRRYIYLFKNESLKDLNAIIPLKFGFTLFEFDDDNKKIDVKSGKKCYNFYVFDKKLYEEFKEKLIDIIEGNHDDIFDKKELIKCSKVIYEDKIFAGVLENSPIFDKIIKEVKSLNKQMDELNNIKNEIEKDCYMDENIIKEIEKTKDVDNDDAD